MNDEAKERTGWDGWVKNGIMRRASWHCRQNENGMDKEGREVDLLASASASASVGARRSEATTQSERSEAKSRPARPNGNEQ